MRNRRGFTLLEIIIVLVILGILIIIAATNFLLWLNHYSAVDFQREFLSQFSEARTRSTASNRQHRLLIDLGAEVVTLERGDAGTGSTVWASTGTPVRGARGAGIDSIIITPGGTTLNSGVRAVIFNPDGQALIQTNIASAATIAPLTQADIRLSADGVGDRATIRVFGWTSKARLSNGWL